jgi:hypothetical protein
MTPDLQRVEQALWEDWDPIGVRAMGGPSDEYDSYAPTILRMLLAGATEEELVVHLYAIETEQMGLGGGQRPYGAARALLRLARQRGDG